jgi:hypothetical protein
MRPMPSSALVSWPKLAFAYVFLLMWPALQMWLSGDWHWVEGWMFGA